MARLLPGSKAPDFRLLATDGAAVQLWALRGAPVVLIFNRSFR